MLQEDVLLAASQIYLHKVVVDCYHLLPHIASESAAKFAVRWRYNEKYGCQENRGYLATAHNASEEAVDLLRTTV